MDASSADSLGGPARGSWRTPWILGAGLLLIAVTFGLYANVLHAPFILDDFSTIQNNLSIRRLWPLEAATIGGTRGRPVANASLAFDYVVRGNRLTAYHTTNIALHALTALVLFGLVRRTLRLPIFRGAYDRAADPIALSAALLWTVHPLQTEAVTYIVQRTEQLMALGYLTTLYCFVRSVTSAHHRAWLFLAVLAAFAGMAAKEVMVTAPVVVWLFDRTFVSGDGKAALRAHRWFYLGLAGTWVALAGLMAGAVERGVGFELGVSPLKYAVAECGVVLHYLKLAVWPAPLVFDYGSALPQLAAGAWLGVLAIVVIGGTVLALVILRPMAGFLTAWPFLILAPTSSVVPVALQPMAEHRMYLPLAGLAVAGAVLLWRAFGLRLWIAVLLLCVSLGAATHRRNETYASALELWRDTAEKQPTNERAHVHLAVADLKSNHPEAARAQLLQALALDPHNAPALINLGAMAAQAGRLDEALDLLEQGARFAPESADAHYNYGWVLLQAGKDRDGARELLQAIAINPDHAEAHNNLGIVLMNLGNHAAAADHFTEALRVNPRDPEVLVNRADALARIGRRESAIADLRAALALRPDFPSARVKLNALETESRK